LKHMSNELMTNKNRGAPTGKIVFACLLVVVVLFSTVHGNAQGVGDNGQTKKYVIFREDDVAPRADFPEIQALNQVHIDKNVPLTLGIIPHQNASKGNQLLQDEQFLSYMRSIASNPIFEFAQHGYTHKSVSVTSPSEFYGRPYAAQYDAIKKGRDDIKQAFGLVPTTFIPPFDKSDNNTLKAAKALGFTEYSTAYRDFNILQGQSQGIKIESVSLVLANESLASMKNKTEQFLNDPQSNDTFVVLYHPSDFSGPNGVISSQKVKLLADYIDYLKGTGRVQFTTFDRSWTTESPVRSSEVASPTETNTSTYVEDNTLTGNGLNSEFSALFIFACVALVVVGFVLLVGRLSSKR
jgi:peptidoglycan/xylan/chitin deacetylase (PgdA/CDA1 family)